MAFANLSIAQRQAGHFEQARTELEHPINLDPTAGKFASLGSLLMVEGRYEEAAQMGMKAIALNPAE